LFPEIRMAKLALSFLWVGALAWPGSLTAQKVNAAITNLSDARVAAPIDAIPRLSLDEIVQRLAEGEKKRAEDLKGYTERRRYSVSYRGFPANLAAAIVVETTYDAPASKQFRVISQTGSRMLADHVLKKLLEAEEEAAQNPSETAPTTANYNFTLIDRQTLDGRLCYVLQVEPRTSSRLLYRGTIWVDATDFAVAKIEAEPARNPSFWIRQTKIHHLNAKTGEFWLPEHNQSETDVRLGGRATLTIDYGAYTMDSADPRPQRADIQSQDAAPAPAPVPSRQ
jgi:hypothetical protein